MKLNQSNDVKGRDAGQIASKFSPFLFMCMCVIQSWIFRGNELIGGAVNIELLQLNLRHDDFLANAALNLVRISIHVAQVGALLCILFAQFQFTMMHLLELLRQQEQLEDYKCSLGLKHSFGRRFTVRDFQHGLLDERIELSLCLL